MRVSAVACLALLATTAVAVAAAAPTHHHHRVRRNGATNMRPLIGILTAGPDGGVCDTVTRWLFDRHPDTQQNRDASSASAAAGDNGCFQGAYVKWIEAAGGRVVPVPYTSTTAELDFLFASVNGLLFTGGGLSLDANTTYYQTAQYLFRKVVAAHDAGDSVPLWGTCMGFQLLNILAAQNHSVLTENAFAAENISLPLDFTAAAATSRLFGPAAPAAVIDTLAHEACTINFHHDGVTPATFTGTPKLATFYAMLATNVDTNGRAFVSAMEAKAYPIYGVQFHPERPQFEYWYPTPSAIDHSPASIAVAQYLANFFVAQARGNGHGFPAAEEDAYLIYHYTPVYMGQGEFGYFF